MRLLFFAVDGIYFFASSQLIINDGIVQGD